MRQRVMIAIALTCDPKILIADEPTTALDVTTQAQIVKLVKNLRDDIDAAIIWITHDLSLIAGFADRIIVMYAGSIVEEAPVDNLYEDPRHPYTVGLLGALPSVSETKQRRLRSIRGAPPDLTELPQFCPFSPRCAYAIDRCRTEKPSLEMVLEAADVEHRVACWVDVRERRPV
jgi:oligopeptide transport system ATP-binding protein